MNEPPIISTIPVNIVLRILKLAMMFQNMIWKSRLISYKFAKSGKVHEIVTNAWSSNRHSANTERRPD